MEVGFALSPLRFLALNGGYPWYSLVVSPLVLVLFSSVGETPELRSNVVPWFETNRFSGLLGKELWSHSSIACNLWVVNYQPSFSLAARVEDWLYVAFCRGRNFMCSGWTCCTGENVIEDHLPTQIIKLALLSLSYMLSAV